MNPWEDRYQDGETHWDKGEATPCLLQWLESEKASGLTRGRVLVPGCGFGHDVRAWAEAGFEAHGLDIAPSAVEGARAQTPAELSNASFVEGDFLHDDPEEPYDFLFEHTCFCAIDPSQRDAYAAAAARWLKPGGQFLAVHYMLPPDEDGPPFGTDREEILERFGQDFELIGDWEPRSWEHRQGKEWMFHWRRL